MAKILIVGAGDVGGRVARQLAADGHDVHALRRRASDWPGVTALQGDVTRPETLTRLPTGLDGVIIALSPGAPGEAAYRATYHDGTRHVLDAIQAQQPWVIWVSSTGVFGEDAGERVSESTPARPATATGAILLASEHLATARGLPGTVVRLSGLYGPGRHRLLEWLRSGRPVQAAPPAWSNRIHVADAAALITHLATQACRGQVLPPLVIGTDACPVPQHEVLDWLAVALDLPALPRRPASAATGKRLVSEVLPTLGVSLAFPDYRAGYADVLAQAGVAWRLPKN